GQALFDTALAGWRKRVPARLQTGLESLPLGGRHGRDFLDLVLAPGAALVRRHVFHLLAWVQHAHGALLRGKDAPQFALAAMAQALISGSRALQRLKRAGLVGGSRQGE